MYKVYKYNDRKSTGRNRQFPVIKKPVGAYCIMEINMMRIRKNTSSWGRKIRTFSGSFTLEAAVIVPLVMVIMVAVIFLTFYVHDKVTMTAVSDYALLENAGNIGKNEQEITTGMTQLLSDRMIAATDISSSLSGSDNKAYASASAHINLPTAMMRAILGEETENLNQEIDISNLSGRKTLLLYKAIIEGASEISKVK